MAQMRYRFGDFELAPALRELWRNGEHVAIPPKSLECLVYLVEHRDRAVGRDELISAIWGRVDVSDTVVAQTLLRARKALNDTGDRQGMIRTVPRFGYRWVAAVEEVAAAEAPEMASTDEQAETAAEPGPAGVVARSPLTEVVSSDREEDPIQATVATHAAGQEVRARRRRWPWLVVVLAVMAAVMTAWVVTTPGIAPSALEADDVVLVLPVQVVPADPEFAWVHLGAMDYIASRLRRNGLKVLPSDQSLHLGAQVGDSRTEESLRKLQQLSGASWIVASKAIHGRDGWTLQLQWYAAGRHHMLETQGSSPIIASAAAADTWLRRLGRDVIDTEELPSALTERLQQVDAELKSGQLSVARALVDSAPDGQRNDPLLRVREGQLEYRSGHIDKASDLFKAIVDHVPPVKDEVRIKALMGLGAVEIRRRDFPRAEVRYSEALTALEGRPQVFSDPALLGNAYNGRGVARVEQGDMEAAVRDMGRARIAMERAGDMVEAAMVDGNIGLIETRRGHLTQALQEFDRAIGVFERFQVRDYLAAILSSKAGTQLALAQPAEALASIEQAQALERELEDADLGIAIAFMQARVLLANGQLAAAAVALERLKAAGKGDDNATWQELSMRERLDRGDEQGAARIARHSFSNEGATSSALALVAVEAALRNEDVATARQWLSKAPAESGDDDDGAALWALARARLADYNGDSGAALEAARDATVMAERNASPDVRIRTGVGRAMLLLEHGQPEAAAAVLGDLGAFAANDYRVAWAMRALYQAMDDAPLAAQAETRALQLRGERELALPPVL